MVAAPTWRSAGSFASSAIADITPGLPAGYQAGDIFVMFCQNAQDVGFVAPSGWTSYSGNASTGSWIYWRRATSSETAPTVSRNGGDHIAAIIHAFSGGLSSGTPLEILGTNRDQGGTSLSYTGLSTTKNNETVITAVIHYTDTNSAQLSGWANSSLTSFTERSDNSTNAGAGGGVALATGTLATAGSSGTTTATLATSTIFDVFQIGVLPSDDISGTETSTIGAVTSTGSGQLVLSGTSSKTIDPVTSSTAGKLALSGSAASTIGAIIGTAAAALVLTATANAQIDPVASTAAAQLVISGSANASIGEISAMAAGERPDPSNVGVVTCQGTGKVQLTATGTSSIGEVTGSSQGHVSISAVGQASVGEIAGTASGTVSLSGVGNGQIGPITCATAAGLSLKGIGSTTLGPVTSKGRIIVPVSVRAPIGRRAVVPTSRLSGRRADF